MANENSVTEWDHLCESVQNVVDALTQCAKAYIDWGISAVKKFVEAVGINNIIKEAAYSKAKKEHPEWVHKATYCKKKRIRKKYHDRIMQRYWRAEE